MDPSTCFCKEKQEDIHSDTSASCELQTEFCTSLSETVSRRLNNLRYLTGVRRLDVDEELTQMALACAHFHGSAIEHSLDVQEPLPPFQHVLLPLRIRQSLNVSRYAQRILQDLISTTGTAELFQGDGLSHVGIGVFGSGHWMYICIVVDSVRMVGRIMEWSRL